MTDLLPSPVWPPVTPPADGHLGTISVSPETAVVAGEYGTWTLTYTAGRFGVDDGGALRIALHTSSDLGAPQFEKPDALDYCSVRCSAPAPNRLEVRYDGDLGIRPWKKAISIRVRDQAMRPGDTITVTIGERSGGSPGARGQTFAGIMRFHALVDAYATGIFIPVATPVGVPVVAGPADHLRVHAPSDAEAGVPFSVTVATMDRWGNAVAHRRERAQLDVAGVQTVKVNDEASGLTGESNPVRVYAPGAAPEHCVSWGDFHAQSEETIGSGTLDEYFSHARDVAAIDFVGHQGNDFQVTRPVWEAIMAKTQQYDATGQFVTFAGYEWSGNTPGGGDHNVHFKGGPRQRYDLNRSGHWQIPDRSDESTDRYPVNELYAQFRGRDDVILIPHVGGRYANLREYFDESLMPLVEIASCWGVFEWFAGDAFETGRVFGFSAGSDDHTARPGMSHAPRGHFATGGGLTAVLARDHSRDAIWEAIKARRTYATTGPRMLLDVTARVGGAGRSQGSGGQTAPDGSPSSGGSSDVDRREYPVGSVIKGGVGEQLEIVVDVTGTGPLWRVEVVRWPEVVYSHVFDGSQTGETRGTGNNDETRSAERNDASPESGIHAGRSGGAGVGIQRERLRIGWTGSRIRARRRMTDWDGTLTLEGGRILSAEGWGFDHVENGISEWDEHSVRWTSETAGDWDGIVVEVEAAPDEPLRFTSGPATSSFTLHEVGKRTLTHDAGGVGQRVEIERDGGPERPRSASFVYRVPARRRAEAGAEVGVGRQIYFVRVTQQDGHVAWSSPFFVG